MRAATVLLMAFAIFVSAAPSLAQSPTKTLDIYIIDGEGGNATLFVSPSREFLLIDTGNAALVTSGPPVELSMKYSKLMLPPE